MPLFYNKFDNSENYVWLNGEIGPALTYLDCEIIVSWLNNSEILINSYSFFSYENFINDRNEEYYQIIDINKKIGCPVKSKREVVTIVNWLNSCAPQLKNKIQSSIYEPMIGDEPSFNEIQTYMLTNKLNYYDALEELRKKKYKKL